MISSYHPKNIRNIAFIGHSSSGKSSLIENLLYSGKSIKAEEQGKVCDFDEEEKIKGFTIHQSVESFDYEGVKINLLDTPGGADFSGEIHAALRICESAVVVLDAELGIQVETEKDWYLADEYQIPRIVFINKMDKVGADFFAVAKDLEERFKVPVLPLEIPIGSGESFCGVIDLMQKKAVLPASEKNEVVFQEIPEKLLGLSEKYYDFLKSTVAETSETLEDKYLEGKEFTHEELEKGLSQCIRQFKIVPLLCGSAAKNIGIRSLLTLIHDEMPAPDTTPEILGFHPDDPEKLISRQPSAEAPFSALIFKTRFDLYAGKLSYFRVFSGTIKTGDTVLTAGKNHREKVLRLYRSLGEKLVEVNSITAGDLGIVAKNEAALTGDTLCDALKPILLSELKLPAPVYCRAFFHEDKKTEEKIIEELTRLQIEDPTLRLEFEPVTHENLIKGMGELHLSLTLDKIERKLKTKIQTREPRIAYLETPGMKANTRYKHKKQSGGHGQYAEVALEIRPLPRGSGFVFIDRITGGKIPKQYIPGVEKGIQEAMKEGPLAGYPMTDLEAVLTDGSFHSVDSSELAFKIAAQNAFKEAAEKSRPALLEPVMKISIHARREMVGEILSDLNARHGKIIEMRQDDQFDDRRPTQLIEAYVPEAHILNYALELKSISQGKAVFEKEHAYYDFMPEAQAEKIKSYQKEVRHH